MIRFGDRVDTFLGDVGLVVDIDPHTGFATVAEGASEGLFLISNLRPAPREDGAPCPVAQIPSRPGPAGACVAVEPAA